MNPFADASIAGNILRSVSPRRGAIPGIRWMLNRTSEAISGSKYERNGEAIRTKVPKGRRKVSQGSEVREWVIDTQCC